MDKLEYHLNAHWILLCKSFFPQMSINVSGAVAIYKDEEYHKQDIGHCHCNKTKID